MNRALVERAGNVARGGRRGTNQEAPAAPPFDPNKYIPNINDLEFTYEYNYIFLFDCSPNRANVNLMQGAGDITREVRGKVPPKYTDKPGPSGSG